MSGTEPHGFFELDEKSLVNQVYDENKSAPVHALLAEMQRRHIEATRALNRSTTWQWRITIVLTVAILFLTWAMLRKM